MVFRLMSDIRTKLLLGTSIGAVTMIFVMAAGIDFSNDANVTVQSFPIMGHVEVLAVNPDGSTTYVQSDNEIVGVGKDRAAIELFSTQTGPFICVGAGTSGTVVETLSGLSTPLATTLVVCDGTGGAQTQAGQDSAGNSQGNQRTVAATITIIDGTQTLTEVALSNAGGAGLMNTGAFTGGVLSHVDLAQNVDVVEGTEVTITFTMTTG